VKINNSIFKLISYVLNNSGLKYERPVKFYRTDKNKLAILFKDIFNELYIETEEEWSLPEEEILFDYKNVSFFDTDVNIELDQDYIYILGDDSHTKFLRVHDYFLDHKTQDLDSVNITSQFEMLQNCFKKCYNTINKGTTDFSSCFYFGLNGIFSTDRVSSTWFKDQKFGQDITVDSSFYTNFNLFKTEFKEIFILYNDTQFGLLGYNDSFRFYILNSQVNTKYPDVQRIFGAMEYNTALVFDKTKLMDCLNNIRKFDNQIEVITVELTDVCRISSQTNDNSAFIDQTIDYDFDSELNIKFNLNLTSFYKCLNDLETINIFLNTEKTVPLKLTDGTVEKYVLVMK
jgi:hypothetical protein